MVGHRGERAVSQPRRVATAHELAESVYGKAICGNRVAIDEVDDEQVVPCDVITAVTLRIPRTP